jgi:general secretion pathway protein K
MTSPRREEGYALIAAVVSIVVFAMMALTIINATRGATLMASAEADRARLSAAADAGVALAIQGLMAKDPAQRWSIDGNARRETFDGMALTIVVEDERGKIALNLINKAQVERMFAAFGLDGLELEAAVDGFMDWRDQDDDVRPRGAEFESYAPRKLKPRNGELRSLGELALISGVGPALAIRIAPVATVNFGANGEFDPRYASPFAVRVSADDEPSSGFAERERALERGGAIEAFRPKRTDSLIGRPLTVRVDASRGQGAHARRTIIIELTGADVRPYVIRARE